jgi:hypothetical protein
MGVLSIAVNEDKFTNAEGASSSSLDFLAYPHDFAPRNLAAAKAHRGSAQALAGVID